MHYVVAELDDSGLGDKVYALPVSAFSTKGEDLVLNVPKERINNKFAFDDDRWSNINDEKYVRDMDAYFNTVSPAGDRPGVSGRVGSADVKGAEPGQVTDKRVAFFLTGAAAAEAFVCHAQFAQTLFKIDVAYFASAILALAAEFARLNFGAKGFVSLSRC